MKLTAVAAMARGSRLLGIAQQILGGDAFPFRATLFDKSPTANWLVVLAPGHGFAASQTA